MKGVLRVVLARRGYTVESPLRAKYSNILKTVEQIITKVLVLLYLTAGTAGIACGDAENQGSMKHEVHYRQSIDSSLPFLSRATVILIAVGA